MTTLEPTAPSERLSTGRLLTGLGIGHTIWATIAHRRALVEVVRDGVANTVGDGIFVQDHARDERAAGFWFFFIGPLVIVIGMLVDDAERRGDWRSVRRSGTVGLAISLLGVTVVPRSGFPAAILVLLRALRRATRSDHAVSTTE